MNAPHSLLPFQDLHRTAAGEPRASVCFTGLRTLWFNTGTLCNLTCSNCYIESSPSNDRLVYLSAEEVRCFLDEVPEEARHGVEIGFTGGEPFMNPQFIEMLEDALTRGHPVLVLTNAMRPMMKCADALLALRQQFGERLKVRVSIDHYEPAVHEEERGRRSWQPMLDGLQWLAGHGFTLDIAARTRWGDDEGDLRAGFARLFAAHGVPVDAQDPQRLVLFPEMDPQAVVPEITTACWDILGVQPESMMCASSRMVVKRRGAEYPVVLACTLLPYDPRFELGTSLADATAAQVPLAHRHCAKFCVLGGGSCSA